MSSRAGHTGHGWHVQLCPGATEEDLMFVRVFENEVQAGQAAALLIGAQIVRKPDSVIGLATGS